jgi:hypothetical protein
MGKTRSCRRTEDQNKIHEKAVKMRKMTDEQLVHYVEDRVGKARSEGYNQGKKTAPGIDTEALLNDIAEIKGIGMTKLHEIRIILENHLRKETE